MWSTSSGTLRSWPMEIGERWQLHICCTSESVLRSLFKLTYVSIRHGHTKWVNFSIVGDILQCRYKSRGVRVSESNVMRALHYRKRWDWCMWVVINEPGIPRTMSGRQHSGHWRLYRWVWTCLVSLYKLVCPCHTKNLQLASTSAILPENTSYLWDMNIDRELERGRENEPERERVWERERERERDRERESARKRDYLWLIILWHWPDTGWRGSRLVKWHLFSAMRFITVVSPDWFAD